jgi:excinuclease UvrABC nuclease subunit
MTDAAEHYNFEAAARLRDRIIAVRRTIETQKVVWRSRVDMDLIAVARAQGKPACKSSWCATASCWARSISSSTARRRHAAELFSEFLKQFYTARSGQLGSMRQWPTRARGSPLALRAARDQQSPVAERKHAPRPFGGGAAAIPKEILVQALPTTQRDRAVADRNQGSARAHPAPAARRAGRLHAAGAEERRAESQVVPHAPGSAPKARRPPR